MEAGYSYGTEFEESRLLRVNEDGNQTEIYKSETLAGFLSRWLRPVARYIIDYGILLVPPVGPQPEKESGPIWKIKKQ